MRSSSFWITLLAWLTSGVAGASQNPSLPLSVTSAAWNESSTTSAPTATPTFDSGLTLTPPNWRNKTCVGEIVNATLAANKRWRAADASTALMELFDSWEAYRPGPEQAPLEFSQYASWFFGGPENMRCTQLFDSQCSITLQCNQVAYPAGFLILNALSKLHYFQRRYYQALDEVQDTITLEMAKFTEVFSTRPPEEGAERINRLVLNAAYAISTIAQSSFNNIFIFSTSFENFMGTTQTIRAQFSAACNSNLFLWWAVGKDFLLPQGSDSIPYGNMEGYFGNIMDMWKKTEVEYVQQLFGARAKHTREVLVNTLDNGVLSSVPDDLDFRNMTLVLKKLIYPHLILTAWATSQYSKRPFILQTGLDCHLARGERNDAFRGWLTDRDHARAATCYNDELWYLLDYNNKPKDRLIELNLDVPSTSPSSTTPFRALFGAETIDGRWGNVTKEELVESAYGGYLQGGRRNGVFKLANTTTLNLHPDQNNPLWFGKGIRVPGYVDMPICRNMWTVISNFVLGDPQKNPNWPCEVVPYTYGKGYHERKISIYGD